MTHTTTLRDILTNMDPRATLVDRDGRRWEVAFLIDHFESQDDLARRHNLSTHLDRSAVVVDPIGVFFSDEHGRISGAPILFYLLFC